MPIDLSMSRAIDVHVHAEVSCHDPEDPVMGKLFDAASTYFKAPRTCWAQSDGGRDRGP